MNVTLFSIQSIGRYMLLVLLLAFQSSFAQTDAVAGKEIFTARCASCHSVAKQATGPALKDVDKRHSEDWIVKFVHSSQSVIQSGDTAAARLFAQFNNTIMPDHPDLSENDIKNIVAFIKEESTKLASLPSGPKMTDEEKAYLGKSSLLHQIIYLDIEGDHKPLSLDHPILLSAIAIAFAGLIWALLLLVKVKSMIDTDEEEY